MSIPIVHVCFQGFAVGKIGVGNIIILIPGFDDFQHIRYRFSMDCILDDGSFLSDRPDLLNQILYVSTSILQFVEAREEAQSYHERSQHS